MKLLKNTLFLTLCIFCNAVSNVVGAQANQNRDGLTLHEMEAIEGCKEWFDKRLYDLESAEFSEFSVIRIPQGFCIDGGMLNNLDYEKFVEVISGYPINRGVIFVVRSPGGMAVPSMRIAEKISQMDSTVVAVDLCASGCANYILAAAKRRIVYGGALLLFHGAPSYRDIKELLSPKFFGDYSDGEYSDEIILKSVFRKLEVLEMQEKFLSKTTVKKHFFSWMEMYYSMDSLDRELLCPKDTSMIMYSPAILADFGYFFVHYDGPHSQKELDIIYPIKGAKHRMCFWGA